MSNLILCSAGCPSFFSLLMWSTHCRTEVSTMRTLSTIEQFYGPDVGGSRRPKSAFQTHKSFDVISAASNARGSHVPELKRSKPPLDPRARRRRIGGAVGGALRPHSAAEPCPDHRPAWRVMHSRPYSKLVLSALIRCLPVASESESLATDGHGVSNGGANHACHHSAGRDLAPPIWRT